jgi:acyl-CoA:acyl-CoA alkyltransferase
MTAFRFKSVCIESLEIFTPPQVVTSAEIEDTLAPVYERLGIPFGTLERLTGVGSRNMWSPDLAPSEIAATVAEKAIESSGLKKEQIGALFSCSVSRDYFEPATACLVHQKLGLSEGVIALDVCNACLGFSDGMFLLANLIESGVVKAGVVVSGETVNTILEGARRALLNNTELERDRILKMLPTLTLGGGGAAFVLCHESLSLRKRKLLGGATRSASQHSDLCVGNGDHCICGRLMDEFPIMETESSKLIAAAAQLGARTWAEASEMIGWTSDDVQHIVCHQVGKQVNEAFYATIGLDISKEFTIYKTRGNVVSAAVPTALTLAEEGRGIARGDKVLLTGFGSGLNAMFMGIEW